MYRKLNISKMHAYTRGYVPNIGAQDDNYLCPHSLFLKLFVLFFVHYRFISLENNVFE